MTLRCVETDQTSFKAALGSLAASVNVITMWDRDGRPIGMTATAFSSVSIDPLLVLVCINRSTRTYEHVATSRCFGVNILGSAAHEISDYCSRPGSDKVIQTEWLAEAQWRTPALSGALAFLECQIDQVVEAGTHAVIIGAVTGIGLNSTGQHVEPLLHFRGSYRHLDHMRPSVAPQPLPIALKE